MTATQRFLLDTNILLHLIRGGNSTAIIEELESRFALFTGRNRVHVSYVSVAEIRVIGEVSQWGASRWAELNRLLGGYIIIPIGGEAILDAYVTIGSESRYVGREMGKNDLWIAATANAYGFTLITSDKDFDHLEDGYFAVGYVAPP